MKIVRIGAGLAIVCAALAGCANRDRAQREGAAAEAGEEEDEIDVRDVAGEAKVSLVDAMRAASAARPGRIVEAELEGETRGGARTVFYEMMIVDGGAVFEVKVDPATGMVTSVEAESDAEEIAELTAIAAAAPAGTQSLGDMVVRAEMRHPGARAVKACFEAEDGELECEVVLVRGRDLIEVDVDPKHPGAAAVAKKLSERGDDDDDDDDDDEDEDEDDEK